MGGGSEQQMDGRESGEWEEYSLVGRGVTSDTVS